MRSGFRDWMRSRLNEDDQDALGPSLGHRGHEDNEFKTDLSGDGARDAFRDIANIIEPALSGNEGRTILNTIVSSLINAPKVPDGIQKQIKNRISEKWSHVIDLNDTEHPGLGVGLANFPGSNAMPGNQDNVVMPSMVDRV